MVRVLATAHLIERVYLRWTGRATGRGVSPEAEDEIMTLMGFVAKYEIAQQMAKSKPVNAVDHFCARSIVCSVRALQAASA